MTIMSRLPLKHILLENDHEGNIAMIQNVLSKMDELEGHIQQLTEAVTRLKIENQTLQAQLESYRLRNRGLWDI